MILTKNIVLKELELFNPKIYELEEKNSSFERLVFFDENQPDLKDNYLYICSLNDLSNCKADISGLYFICICEIEKAKNISIEKKCSVISVNESAIDIKELFNKLYYIFNRYNEWDHKLDKLILRDSSIQDLIDESEEFFDNPFFVVDINFRIQGNTNKIPAENEFFSIVASRKSYTEESVQNVIKRKLLTDEDQFKKLDIMDPPTLSNCKQYIKSIYNNNNKSATFIQVCCNREPKKSDEDIISYFINKIEYLLVWNRKGLNIKQNRYDYFIQDLLEKTYSSEEDLKNRAEIVKMPCDGKYILLKIAFKNFSVRSATFVLGILRNVNPFYRVTLYEQNIVIISMLDFQHYDTTLLKQQYEWFKSFLEKYEAYVGIGGIFHGLKYTSDEYNKAGVAINIGRMMDENKRMFCYKDYYIYHNLLASSNNISLDCLYYRKLNKLIDMDKKDNTDNLDILRVFLKNDRNVTETARLVNLHRNSVLYRIKKIEEILSINLDSYETRMRILLSFYALDLKEKMSKKGELTNTNILYLQK